MEFIYLTDFRNSLIFECTLQSTRNELHTVLKNYSLSLYTSMLCTHTQLNHSMSKSFFRFFFSGIVDYVCVSLSKKNIIKLSLIPISSALKSYNMCRRQCFFFLHQCLWKRKKWKNETVSQGKNKSRHTTYSNAVLNARDKLYKYTILISFFFLIQIIIKFKCVKRIRIGLHRILSK